jgi:ketol-acid reductoisomerase
MDRKELNRIKNKMNDGLEIHGEYGTEAVLPVFEELYARVKDGRERERVLESTSGIHYRSELEKELKELRESEIWQAGEQVRKLRRGK